MTTTAPARRRARRPAARVAAQPAVPPAADELRAAVTELKVNLAESLAVYGKRVGGELDRVLAMIEGEDLAPEETIEAMLERSRDIKLKPRKGRIKDLVRLEDVAEDLVAMLPGADD